LTNQRERVVRLFANEFAEASATEMQRIRLFIGACIGRVFGVGAESFPTERFAFACESRHEGTSGFYSAAQHDPAPEDDE
jgi:hypothetical protein